MVGELARGIELITGLAVKRDAEPGWIGVVCTDEEMALWMLRAIIVENVSVRRSGAVLYLPAGPDFRLQVRDQECDHRRGQDASLLDRARGDTPGAAPHHGLTGMGCRTAVPRTWRHT